MKIVIVNDKPTSAIARLSGYVQKYNKQHQVVNLSLHPKRPSVEQLTDLAKHLKDADILHVQYWKSGEVIREHFPKEFERVKTILTHHNPYDIDKQVWSDIYDAVVVKNQTQQAYLGYAYHIPHSVDLNEFEFNPDYDEEVVKGNVNMVVGRIEGKKGVREVAQACHELGYKLHLVGRISKAGYFKEVMGKYGDSVVFYENATEEQLKEVYKKCAVHVCNSVDGFESGTLPILESMAIGLPVVTRSIGQVPDIYDGKNMAVRVGAYDDIEDLKKVLQEVVDNRLYREKVRDNGWDTVKNMGGEKMARLYSKLYWRVFEKEPLMSVIIPTCNRVDSLPDILAGAINQTYKKYEIIVVDSSDPETQPVIQKTIEAIKLKYNKSIKYIPLKRHGYNLAQARNTGAIEAEGELLVFCDDRLVMDKQALEVFKERHIERSWLWGTKDGYKKGFVENFSCVARKDFIVGGMFTTSIPFYGGLTQETRTRFDKQGVVFSHCEEAKALSILRAKSKNSRRKDIVRAKYHIYKMYEN